MDKKLLSCPFCGVAPRIFGNVKADRMKIACENDACPSNPQVTSTRDEAPKRWNTRVPTGRAVLTDLGRKVAKPDDADPANDPSVTRDLILLLIDIPRDVDAPAFAAALLERVSIWTPETRDAVEEWCAAAHLRASDNDVEMPRQPEHLTALLHEIRNGGIK